MSKRARGGDKEAKERNRVLEPVIETLRGGRPARKAKVESATLSGLRLLTAKPVMYVCNVDESSAPNGNALAREVAARAAAEGAACVTVCAALEAEIGLLEDAAERAALLAEYGLVQSGLSRAIRAGYELLDLVTFLTSNANQTHAWTVPRGTPAVAAAACVHGDFAQGFIRVEVITCDEFLALGGEPAAWEAGKMRIEGRDYVVCDGDVLKFRFNV